MKLRIMTSNEKEQYILNELKKQTAIFSGEHELEVDVILKRVNRQGYSILKKRGACEIEYGTYPELCRALLFLSAKKKLTENAKWEERCLFKDFGIMLDISRNAVLRKDTVKNMIVYAACMGYRFVGLYMEDTFLVTEEAYLGYMRGRMTHGEIREIDEYATKFEMELRPYIQTLAHVNQITRYEEYQRIIDTKDILLAGEKRTEEFLEHIIKNISECFSSENINIGMDEAELIGAGKYLTKHGFKEKSHIMMEHLDMVLRLCRKYHKKPQMWSDMFVHMLDHNDDSFEVPEELRIIYWDYYSTEQKHYSGNLKRQLAISKNLGFAGGAWKWTGFVPHNGYSIRAGEASIKACLEHKIDSYTITCWGDDGAEASCFSVLPTFYKDALIAYDSKMENAGFEKLTGYKWNEFLNIDLVNPYLENDGIHNNSSKYLLYNDPLIGTFDSVVKQDTVCRFEQAQRQMEAMTGQGRFDYIFVTMQRLCEVLKRKADLGIRIREAYEKKDTSTLLYIAQTDIPQIQCSLMRLYEAFDRQWKKENKSFGFEIQTIRFGGLNQRLEDARQQLEKYVTKEIESIEELDEEIRPFHYFEKNNIEELNYNLWSDIVSPSVIG